MASHLSDLPILYKYYTTAKYHVQFYYYIFPYITILKCTWKTTITGNIHIKDMKKRVGRYWLRGPFVCVWVCVLVYMYILCVCLCICVFVCMTCIVEPYWKPGRWLPGPPPGIRHFRQPATFIHATRHVHQYQPCRRHHNHQNFHYHYQGTSVLKITFIN